MGETEAAAAPGGRRPHPQRSSPSLVNGILWAYVCQHWGLTLFGLVFMLFVPFNEIVVPHLHGRVIAGLQDPQQKGLGQAIWLVAAAMMVAHAGMLLRDRTDEQFLPSLQCFVKTELMERLFGRHSQQFRHLTSGEIVYVLSVVPDIACL